MVDKILLTFLFSEFLFALSGGLLIGYSVMMQTQMTQAPSLSNVATNLLLNRTPLTGSWLQRAIMSWMI
jgi:fructose-specific phosphotransferase system IIC component